MRAGREFIARDEEVVIRATPEGKGYRILDSPQEGRLANQGSRARLGGDRDDASPAVRRERRTDRRRPYSPRRRCGGRTRRTRPRSSDQEGQRRGLRAPIHRAVVEDLCLPSIAYLFLSAPMQRTVYDQAFDPIRDALQDGNSHAAWSVESFLVRSRPDEHGTASASNKLARTSLTGTARRSARLESRIPAAHLCEELLPTRSYHLDLVTAEEKFVA